MKHHRHDSELDDIRATLGQLPAHDVSPAISEHILAEAHGILLRRKRLKTGWKEGLARIYTGFLEPALVSSLMLFYTLWAFGRAVQFLHL
jgi:hypothetical protein